MLHGKYGILVAAPPGAEVAPNGFPADPRPTQGPLVFRDGMELRVKVFCEEQNCSLEGELDEDDLRSWHYVVYDSSRLDKRVVAAVARLVPPPHGPHPNGFRDPGEKPYFKLGRLATNSELRGIGLGRWLIENALHLAWERRSEIAPDWDGLVLCHAQVSAEGMYKKVGFVTDERLGRWIEEGIEHVGMWRDQKLYEPSNSTQAPATNGA